MKYQPKFKITDPKTKEEKLICELTKDLHEVQKAFVRLNQSCTNNEIFITLRDASLGFAGQTITGLLELMLDNSEKFFFLKECQDIFNCYIQQASENIK
jgi:hypothetical protein